MNLRGATSPTKKTLSAFPSRSSTGTHGSAGSVAMQVPFVRFVVKDAALFIDNVTVSAVGE